MKAFKVVLKIQSLLDNKLASDETKLANIMSVLKSYYGEYQTIL